MPFGPGAPGHSANPLPPLRLVKSGLVGKGGQPAVPPPAAQPAKPPAAAVKAPAAPAKPEAAPLPKAEAPKRDTLAENIPRSAPP